MVYLPADCLGHLLHHRGSWRDLYLQRPHLRFDGVYVSRNTYLRTGLVEWRVKNPVHLVCYFRYYRQERSPTAAVSLTLTQLELTISTALLGSFQMGSLCTELVQMWSGMQQSRCSSHLARAKLTVRWSVASGGSM